MNAPPVPRLNLAPQLNRPLSLWNPLDYVRLLYWTFFFPQALRWYVRQFGKPEYQEGHVTVWQTLRNDPIQRRLILQAVISPFLATGSIAWMLLKSGRTPTRSGARMGDGWPLAPRHRVWGQGSGWPRRGRGNCTRLICHPTPLLWIGPVHVHSTVSEL